MPGAARPPAKAASPTRLPMQGLAMRGADECTPAVAGGTSRERVVWRRCDMPARRAPPSSRAAPRRRTAAGYSLAAGTGFGRVHSAGP